VGRKSRAEVALAPSTVFALSIAKYRAEANGDLLGETFLLFYYHSGADLGRA
jgi:hypothetical protein